MTEISRAALFGKLNPIAYKAIEGATIFCKLRGNPYVELVHWIHQILQVQDSDLHHIVRHFELDPGRLAADVTAALDRLPRGATSITDLAPQIEDAVERGWVFGTLMFNDSQVRTGHLVLGAMKTTHSAQRAARHQPPVRAGEARGAGRRLPDIVHGSPEGALPAVDGSQVGAPGEASGAIAPAAMGKQDALRQFCTDLTERARNGELDPIVGRDAEIRQVIDVLMRRRQNNPILTGEAGVGKTAVVEGFALRIAAGDVPPMLADVSACACSTSACCRPARRMKGEFEQRLRQVIEEVQSSPKPIILFIDEAHTLIGAGGAAGTGDAANLLKPALARGTLRTIAATTWAEYKKYFEKDPALTRRFQVVQVDEPDEAKAILMMRGIASPLEKHHRVQVLDEAIEAAVRLSHRYIPARQLPDKSVSLLDTACARVAVSQHATPPAVEDCRRRIAALETEIEIIGRESAIGIDATARDISARAALAEEQARLVGLETRWGAEKALVDQVLALRARLRAGRRTGGRRAAAADRRRARGAARRAAQPAGDPGRAPGRNPADPAERRRAGGGRRGRRLDRHPGRTDGEERGAGGAATSPTPWASG